MKTKKLLLSLLILFSFIISSSACDFTIKLYDDYGDGWWQSDYYIDGNNNTLIQKNGYYMRIYVNGTIISPDSLSLPDVSTSLFEWSNNYFESSFSFSANPGDTVFIEYFGGGIGPYVMENAYEVYMDDFNMMIHRSGIPGFYQGRDDYPRSHTFIVPDCNDTTPWDNYVQKLIDPQGCNVDVFNVDIIGNLSCVNEFNKQGLSIGIDSGLVLTTGHNASDVFGPASDELSSSNFGGEDSLLHAMLEPVGYVELLKKYHENDAIVLEFDFIPKSRSFDLEYVLASEEFDLFNKNYDDLLSGSASYLDSTDIFGIFLSGPRPGGGTYENENIALIPGTDKPASISSINSYFNSELYVDNNGGTDIAFNGFTKPLNASAPVFPCQTYHLKIAIADVVMNNQNTYTYYELNRRYDSGLFLKAKSISSSEPKKEIIVEQLDNIVEGELNKYVFTRADALNTYDDLIFDFDITGNIDLNSDLSYMPLKAKIPAGSISDTIYFAALNDDLQESDEIMIISIQIGGCACNPDIVNDTIHIVDTRTQLPATIDENTLSNTDLNIYPNPNNGSFNLKFTSDNEGKFMVKLSNITGQVVYSNEYVKNRGELNTNINLESIAKGVYYLQLMFDGNMLNKKIVIN